MKNHNFLMRSLMFVPAHNEKLLDSALKYDADVLMLDIEDSVQPEENKQKARDNIKKYLSEGKFANRVVFSRVNDRESGHLFKDVYELSLPGITGFMYPKAKNGGDIYFFDKLLETIEYEKKLPINTFKIIALIETPAAVININEICSSSPNRLIAIAFGNEDFMTELGGQHDNEGNSIFTARALIAMGAKANNIVPIDTVHIKVHDLEDLERNLIIGKNLGFEGMLVLHPKELPLVHKYYSPSKEEIEWAEEMIQLSEEAKKIGKGVDLKNNKFIGPPMVKKAKNILSKVQLLERGKIE